MAPINLSNVSLYKEAKASLISLIQQIAIVFSCFTIMLVVTGGAPSEFIIAISFLLGIVFVAWSEQRRIINIRVESPFVKNFISDVENSFLNSEQVEWRIAEWLDNEIIPERAIHDGGWTLAEREIPDNNSTAQVWNDDEIPLPAISERQQKRKRLFLKKNLKIQEVDYFFCISSSDQNYWKFSLIPLNSNTVIPARLELRLINLNNRKLIRKVSKASSGKKDLVIEVSIDKGTRLAWDIEPKPKNYFYEILSF